MDGWVDKCGAFHGEVTSPVTQTNRGLVTRATHGPVPGIGGINPCPLTPAWCPAGIGQLVCPKEAWEPSSSLLPLRKMPGLQGWAPCPPPGDLLTLEPSGGPGRGRAQSRAGH